jgi:hypothetical protein
MKGKTLPDAMLFDEAAEAIALRDIDECLESFASERTTFPGSEALAYACEVLLLMGNSAGDPAGRHLVDLLNHPRGVSYAEVVPLLQIFRNRISAAIEHARADRRGSALPSTSPAKSPF